MPVPTVVIEVLSRSTVARDRVRKTRLYLTHGVSEVWLLDRPNPVGGSIAAGFTLEESQLSFVGQYPIPAAYGMTAGELALAIQAQGWLPGLGALQVEVVTMDGWTRSMLWPDTGREWAPTSAFKIRRSRMGNEWT